MLGILPGGGAMLASFAVYWMVKKVSPNRAQFGRVAIEGVAAPESADNAGAQTSFIPMLTLGIPSNLVMALMAGAMIIPRHPAWTGGDAGAADLVFCAVEVFSLNNTEFDICLMALFGVFSYGCGKLRCGPAPMLVGSIVGAMMKEYLGCALMVISSHAWVFLRRSISAGLLAAAALGLAVVVLPSICRRREVALRK